MIWFQDNQLLKSASELQNRRLLLVFCLRSVLIFVFIIFTEVCLKLHRINGVQIKSLSQQWIQKRAQIWSTCDIMQMINQLVFAECPFKMRTCGTQLHLDEVRASFGENHEILWLYCVSFRLNSENDFSLTQTQTSTLTSEDFWWETAEWAADEGECRSLIQTEEEGEGKEEEGMKK